MLAISTCHFPSRDRAVVLGNVFDLFETHAEQAVRHMKHGFHEFVQSYGALKNKWHFLTGNKKMIYDMARYSYLINALEEDGSEEGFLHSELFILVDKHKRIRGMYDGTDSLAVVKLISDIHLLKQE